MRVLVCLYICQYFHKEKGLVRHRNFSFEPKMSASIVAKWQKMGLINADRDARRWRQYRQPEKQWSLWLNHKKNCI